jgi:lambda family phage holin
MPQNESQSMPQRDPGFWQHLLSVISHTWPQAYAAIMACVVAVVRGMQAGGKPLNTCLEAILCGCLTLASMPVLEYFGLGQKLAVAVGAAVGFLGTEWIRDRATIIADAALSWWRRK